MVLRYSAAKGRYYDSVDIEQATAPKRWRALLRARARLVCFAPFTTGV